MPSPLSPPPAARIPTAEADALLALVEAAASFGNVALDRLAEIAGQAIYVAMRRGQAEATARLTAMRDTALHAMRPAAPADRGPA